MSSSRRAGFHRDAVLARVSTCSGRGALRLSSGFSYGQVSRLSCQHTQNRSITHSARFTRGEIQRESADFSPKRGATEIHRHFLNLSKRKTRDAKLSSIILTDVPSLGSGATFFHSCNIFRFGACNKVGRGFFFPLPSLSLSL